MATVYKIFSDDSPTGLETLISTFVSSTNVVSVSAINFGITGGKDSLVFGCIITYEST